MMAGRLPKIARLGLLILIPPALIAGVIGWVAYRAGLGDSLDFEPETQAAHARLTRIFDRIELPSGYTLVARQMSGSFYPLDSELPSQERLYRVDSPIKVSRNLIAALRRQGWRTSQLFESCGFQAVRGEAVLAVNFQRQRNEPDESSGPFCPRQTWPRVYASILLHLK
jgi:hypothetical protein